MPGQGKRGLKVQRHLWTPCWSSQHCISLHRHHLPILFIFCTQSQQERAGAQQRARTVRGAWSGRRSGAQGAWQAASPTFQPTARPQEGEADSPGSGHCGWGVQVRTRATSQGPKLAREGPEHPRAFCLYFSPKANVSSCLLGLEILLKKRNCLAAHRAKPWK